LTASDGEYTVGTGGDIAISRPIHVYQAFLRDNTSANNPIDIPLRIVGENEYWMLSNKASEGRPVILHYDAEYDGSSNQGTNAKGKLYLWPEPDSNTATNLKLFFRYQRPFLDFNAATDELDMPQEWYNAVRLNLAKAIAPEYGYPIMDYDRLVKEADEALELAKSWDTEKQSAYFMPDYTTYENGN
jgi:hypothetical protein